MSAVWLESRLNRKFTKNNFHSKNFQKSFEKVSKIQNSFAPLVIQ